MSNATCMPDTIVTHLANQGLILRKRLVSGGPIRAIIVHLLVVGVFGVFLPWWLGFQFLDPVTITAYCCLGVMFSAPAAAQAFAGERPGSMGEALARIAVTVLYGEIMTAAILLAGFLTFFSNHSSAMFAPDFLSLGEAGALGLSGSIAMAAIAAWLALRFSAGAARVALRVIFLALLLLLVYRSRSLPDVVVAGTLVCLGVAVVVILALRQVIAHAVPKP
jgi:hypothetical protein